MDAELITTPEMSEEERRILAEVALHLVTPSALQRLLDLAGKPIDAVMARLAHAGGRLLPRISEAVETGVRRAVQASIAGGVRLSRDGTVLAELRRSGFRADTMADVRMLPLAARDAVADSFASRNAALVTTEGAVMGATASLAEAVPGAQLLVPALVSADIAASLTLLSRHLVQLAACYGYSLHESRGNLAHVLAAMTPQQYSHDEGFLPMKVYAMNAAREAGEFLIALGRTSSKVGFERAMQQLGREAPQLVRLVSTVMERLGVQVTEKAFGMLVPLAGGAVNGSLNLAFQLTGHRTGKDYFRLLVLAERHGRDAVHEALAAETARLRAVL